MTQPISLKRSSETIQSLYFELAPIRDRLIQHSQKDIQAASTSGYSTSIVVPTSSITLDNLCERFKLSSSERNIILLCLGMEIDPSFAELCSQAQGNPKRNYPTFALALTIFPEFDFTSVSSQYPLLYWQLILVDESTNLFHAPLRISRRILCFLLEINEIHPYLANLISPISFPAYFPTLSHKDIADRMTAYLASEINSSSYPCVQLCGADIITRQAIAFTVSQKFDFSLMRISADMLPINIDECHRILRLWIQESLLTDSILLLECDNINPSEPIRLISLVQLFGEVKPVLIISSKSRLTPQERDVVTYDVPNLTYEEQLNIWYACLGGNATLLNGHLPNIVSQFNLPAATIQTASLQVKHQAPENLAEQLWNFCRIQARPRLDDLARRIESSATWEDLVLPERENMILQDIATHLGYRAKVYQEWGFSQKSHRSLGITALFHGQSGTGKTLAAEVLAGKFGLDLYHIDLSAVISKYIGETEKNLCRIFDAAEVGGVVLLFDEADAIFGKRTEVRSSHDRHANVEVAYLLQRMESYQGLAILTTNFRDAIDQAFTRRIRFIVQFPFPDATARKEIWQRAFPSQTPTQGLKFDQLGNLNASGGTIRGIALNVAFIAARSHEPVCMHHILQATRQEYLKIGRSLTDSEIRGWI